MHYDNATEPSREVEYDYPTGVGSGEHEIAARKVDITSNPAYGTVTYGKEHIM